MATQPTIGTTGSGGPRWVAIWLLAFAVATPLGWSSVAFVYFGMLAVGRPLTFEQATLAGLQDWYSWALLTPIVFSLGRRVRLERDQWVGAHIHLSRHNSRARGSGDGDRDQPVLRPHCEFIGSFSEVYPRIVLRYFHFAFIIYWVIVAAAHATEYYKSTRDGELESLALQAELTQAQLAALRMQLQPHFLFNTLHTIASLVREGRGEAATATIARLGDLFRQTLGNVQRNEVPLREELSFIEAYLEIEQSRFSDRLAVRFEVGPDTLEAWIPTMALQPLVENAIRHGIARDPSAGRVEVSARRRDQSLRVEVRNDGPSYTGGGGSADG